VTGSNLDDQEGVGEGSLESEMSRLLACVAAILTLSQTAPPAKPAVGMQADVDRLVARAGEMDRLWPWMAADGNSSSVEFGEEVLGLG
jgi:hypothetical protein